MMRQLSFFDEADYRENQFRRRAVLVSLLTPSGVSKEKYPAICRQNYHVNRHDRYLLTDEAGHRYVIVKVFNCLNVLKGHPLILDATSETLTDYLAPKIEPILKHEMIV